MSKEMDFFIYLLESYAADRGVSAADVLTEWRERGLVDYVYDITGSIIPKQSKTPMLI